MTTRSKIAENIQQNQQIYIASPIGNPEILPNTVRKLTGRIIHLINKGTFNLPDSDGNIDGIYFPASREEVAKNSKLSQQMCALKMLTVIDNSQVVVAFHPELSQGVCLEIGYALAKNIPVHVYRFDDMLPKDNYVSWMLPPAQIIPMKGFYK